jgi:hypothetical protein
MSIPIKGHPPRLTGITLREWWAPLYVSRELLT